MFDIDGVAPDLYVFHDLLNRHICVSQDDLCQQSLVFGILMPNHYKRKAGIGRNIGEKLLKCFQSPR